jgi:hypothetical protein
MCVLWPICCPYPRAPSCVDCGARCACALANPVSLAPLLRVFPCTALTPIYPTPAAIRLLKCPAHVKEAEWTSQAIARILGISEELAQHFSDRNGAARPAGRQHATGLSAHYVDRMDVDWVLSIDPKDSLQLDVIERLPGYLRDILGQAAPPAVISRTPPGRGSTSIYALPFEKRAFGEWTLADCVQYTGPHGLRWLDKAAADHLTQFLARTSENSGYPSLGRGKAGSTWTTKQWQNAMQSLRRIGTRANREWENPSIWNYLDEVRDAAGEISLSLE